MINKDIYVFELKRNFKSWLIWLISLGAMSVLFMLLFLVVDKINIDYDEVLSGMGITGIFGLSMKYTIGYFGTEVLLLIQLAGAIYAAGLAIKLLAGEEKDRTAEFLLTNPILRKKIWNSKLLTLVTFIFSLVIALAVINFACVFLTDFSASVSNTLSDYAGFFFSFFTTFLMMLFIGCCCYLLSAVFNRRGGFGIAIGVVLAAYIINIVYSIAAGAISDAVLKDIFRIVQYLSPFSFSEAMVSIGYIGHQKIISANEFWLTMIGVIVWIVISFAALFFGQRIYNKKDIL